MVPRSKKGWISVGISADTAEFAVNTIRKWWKISGSKNYGQAKELLICADAGESNGYRSSLWKRELQKLANEIKIKTSVRHFPPGTSKWNKIEHRLFSSVTINWRGKPLVSYQVIVQLIAATKTRSGLTVKAYMYKRKYKKGIKVSKDELQRMSIEKEDFHGEWNYSIRPQKR